MDVVIEDDHWFIKITFVIGVNKRMSGQSIYNNTNITIYICMKWPRIETMFNSVGPNHGLYSLSGKTSYQKISWSLEAARFGFKLFQSLWNLEGTSAALPPRCLSNFKAIRPWQRPISRLRDFIRFGGKTSYRLVNRGRGLVSGITKLVRRVYGCLV